MAQTKNKPAQRKRPDALKRYANVDFLRKLLLDPAYLPVTCWGLLVFEVVLNVFIVQRINYTEIDWRAYMQEVGGFLNGTLDYKELRGDTGPLVYPAGFVYVYSLLYYVTSRGQNIRLAQYIFVSLYLLQLHLSFAIYRKTQKVPPYALILSTLTSYRIHSIFVLRLFNDPVAVVLFYASLHLFLSDRWIAGSLFYSLAVSVKMNVLLYAPCLLTAYLTNLTYERTALNLAVCALVQLALGAPFLYVNPWSYLRASFDLGRVFEHEWTVNYRFLERGTFEDRLFHLGLLALHVVLLLAFLPAVVRYLKSYAVLTRCVADLKVQAVRKDKGEELMSEEQRMFLEGESGKKNFSRTAQLFVLPFFVTNLIGVACARSLHYQFYSWYFHSLLYLVHCTPYGKPMMFLILGVVEFSWNAYPSTALSSFLLHVCHVVLLYGVYKVMRR